MQFWIPIVQKIPILYQIINMKTTGILFRKNLMHPHFTLAHLIEHRAENLFSAIVSGIVSTWAALRFKK